ncbi:hypothetical protein [Ruegeria atlantica]|uniref:hypothetical protein n=1 Tax=Ruegeria atlantica TaxID=81569 RepID=UPI002494F067|nr:hypothetical protein [Ruegeria atlantica]
MKTILIACVAFSLTAPLALAEDNPNKPTDKELLIKRCANNGGGNDGEYIRYDRKTRQLVCIKNRGSENHDLDPN